MITIDSEFKSLIPPLSTEEYALLEANLIADGCRDPLVLWNNTIVDGHNRHEICTKYGLAFNTVAIEFEGKPQARIWMRANQIGRRNLSSVWSVDLALGNKADLAEIGAAKYRDTVGRPSETIVINIDNDYSPKHNTQAEIAKAAGVSTGTVAMAEIVMREAPEIWEKAKAGELTIGGAHTQVKTILKLRAREEEVKAQKQAIYKEEILSPSGLFDVISIDPPWAYGREYDPDGSRVASPYPEMTQAQLLEIELPTKPDSVLFLWCTHQFFFDAKNLLDNWGFTYKAVMVWDKERMGMGSWLRMQCEFCLVGIKGNPVWDNTTHRDIIREARREHSRKPESFYLAAENITAGRRLEYFARSAHNGWEVFGNDTQKF